MKLPCHLAAFCYGGDLLPILLDKVRISGFRGIRNLELTLPRVVLLIGPNNCGKTSVLKAMQLAIGDYGRQLSEEDFHIDANEQRSELVTVDVRMISVNDAGERENSFERPWINEFGDKIQADVSGQQFYAFRTTAKSQSARTGFSIERHALRDWPSFPNWLEMEPLPDQKISARSEFMPFVSIDAQRDIHHELNEKSSFVGRVLAQVKYEKEDIETLEEMILKINTEAVAKSEPLVRLKHNLDALNESFGGKGVADVTPFPKKLRDLSKNFRVHFGQSEASSFSMEYHGMGTRSWASMLAVKAFTDLMGDLHSNESEPYHPIMAAEEPEAHLHPNAQRSLFAQLLNSKGQAIISTHSPYLAAMGRLPDLRSLSVRSGHTRCYALDEGISQTELKILHREILRNKGELLFANAIVLYEGQTEDQVVPTLFEAWFGATAFSKGVCLSAVNGRNYAPYVKLAGSLGIPLAIVSDNDAAEGMVTRNIVENQLEKIGVETQLELTPEWFGVEFLNAPNDFEAEIINACGLRNFVIEAFVKIAESINPHPNSIDAKRASLQTMTDEEIIAEMRGAKTNYSSYLAEVLMENMSTIDKEVAVPQAFKNAFRKVEEWLA